MHLLSHVCEGEVDTSISLALQQWDALSEHVRQAAMNEKCFTAQQLAGMYKNPLNKHMLQFIQPVLRECQRVNKLFQSQSADPASLLTELKMLIVTIGRLIISTGRARVDLLTVKVADFLNPTRTLGAVIDPKLVQLRTRGSITAEAVRDTRELCYDFMLTLVT